METVGGPVADAPGEVRMTVSVNEQQVRQVLLRQPGTRYLWVAVAMALTWFLLRAAISGDSGGMVSVAVTSVPLLALIAASMRYGARRAALRWTQDAQWVVTAEGVTTSSQDGASTVLWSGFTRLEGLPLSVVFRTRGGGILVLPRTALPASDLSRVENWARSAGVAVQGSISAPAA